MKKSAKISIGVIVVVVIALAITFASCTPEKKDYTNIDIAQWQNDEEQFEFYDMEWGMSYEDVEKQFGDKLTNQFDEELNKGMTLETYTYYTEDKYNLVDFKDGQLQFEFKDDKLISVGYYKGYTEDPQEEYISLYEKMKKTYGEPTESTMTEDKFTTQSCTWINNDTRINMSKTFWQEDDISVGVIIINR